MKILILTSSLWGTAAHHLPILIESGVCEIEMVILTDGKTVSNRRYYSRIVRKILKIGLMGALNGIRMRKWYTTHLARFTSIRSNLEEVCGRNGIPFFCTPAINSEETRGLISQAKVDIAVSLGNGYISKNIFNIPKYGMINIHHEMLPAFRNAQSIIWQIYNGSSVTGYTIHRINHAIDGGDILYQEEVPIQLKESLSDTVSLTSVLLMKRSAAGLTKVLGNLEFYLEHAKLQGDGKSYTTPSIVEFCKIWRNHKRMLRLRNGKNDNIYMR